MGTLATFASIQSHEPISLSGFDNVFLKKNIIIIITVFIQFKILSRETGLSAYMHTHIHRHYTHRHYTHRHYTHRHYTHMSGVKNMAGLLFWKKKCVEVRVKMRLELRSPESDSVRKEGEGHSM